MRKMENVHKMFQKELKGVNGGSGAWCLGFAVTLVSGCRAGLGNVLTTGQAQGCGQTEHGKEILENLGVSRPEYQRRKKSARAGIFLPQTLSNATV